MSPLFARPGLHARFVRAYKLMTRAELRAISDPAFRFTAEPSWVVQLAQRAYSAAYLAYQNNLMETQS